MGGPVAGQLDGSFVRMDGGAPCPIEPDAFLERRYVCLRALGIRVRGPYAMKDSYVSTALTCSVNAAWSEAQTGVRDETLERHYGKWLRTEGPISSRTWPEWPPSWTPLTTRIRKLPISLMRKSGGGGN